VFSVSLAVDDKEESGNPLPYHHLVFKHTSNSNIVDMFERTLPYGIAGVVALSFEIALVYTGRFCRTRKPECTWPLVNMIMLYI
jgi:hypothetical protein